MTRPRAVLGLLLAVTLVLTGQFVVPAAAGPRGQPDVELEHFMTGLACVESGGRYDAVNPKSGAYGKYQIMPRNWKAWARRFLDDGRAEPTPQNQEAVARERIERLYEHSGSWRRVAYWWLTGGTVANEARWTSKAAGYVDSVMAYAARAAAPERGGYLPARCFPRNFLDRQPGGDDAVTGQAGAPAADHVVVKGGSVYVRRGPGPESRAVAVVRRGAILKVTDREDVAGREWLEVKLGGGRRGWIAGWYTER